MSTITVIGAPQSNFVRVLRMVCHEKGIGYDLEPVRPHTPPVQAISPVGKIPVMRHGDVAIAESRAMCGYLESVFPGPKLIPADPVTAAKCEQWISIVTTHIDQILVRQYFAAYRFPGTPDGSPDRARIDAVLPKCQAVFDMLENELMTHTYLGGDAFTLADIFLFPIISYMPNMPETAEMLQHAPHIQAWVERVGARASAAATVPPPLPAR